MKFAEETFRGTLIRRYKRFLADVEMEDGATVTVHCPNSGSMLGCDREGAKVLVSRSTNKNRKLAYTWELVRVGRTWVGINTMRTNRVAEEGLLQGEVPELAGFERLEREVPYGQNSRIDLLLHGLPSGPPAIRAPRLCYVEVKNVTLAWRRLALFPDAVTARGTKHLGELCEMIRRGHRAVMFYLVNRQDCDAMAPARDVDPVYAEALGEAVDQGVEVLVYRSRVGVRGISLGDRLPFRLWADNES